MYVRPYLIYWSKANQKAFFLYSGSTLREEGWFGRVLRLNLFELDHLQGKKQNKSRNR